MVANEDGIEIGPLKGPDREARRKTESAMPRSAANPSFPSRDVEVTGMKAICSQGHEADLGDIPLDENVRWECPTCQSVEVVRAPTTAPDDVRYITEGDAGSATES